MKTIIAIILVLVVGFGLYLYLNSDKEENQINQPANSDITQEDNQRDTADVFDEDADLYTISSGSTVSYTAQKEFFSRPTEAVTGTTNDVFGQASIDLEERKISLVAEINPKTLSTGTENRDKYVSDQFTSNISVKVEDVNFGELGESGEVSFTSPVSLTINGINKNLGFEIEGTVSEGEAKLSGKTSINMEDFNIEPASLAKVYTVDEVAEISFDITLVK